MKICVTYFSDPLITLVGEKENHRDFHSFNVFTFSTASIRVAKVSFRVFDKLKNEIQNSILRFCFYFITKNEIQIIYSHFQV